MKKLTAHPQHPGSLSALSILQADWESLRSFAAFIDAGSFSGAARALGVTHATIGRRLQQLETALQAPLFIRRADEVELTRLGESVLNAAHAMQEQTRQLARTLAGEDLRLEGKLRLACTDAIGTLFLAPRLPALLQQWPALDVEFALAHQTVSLARREADLALRFGKPQDGELIARAGRGALLPVRHPRQRGGLALCAQVGAFRGLRRWCTGHSRDTLDCHPCGRQPSALSQHQPGGTVHGRARRGGAGLAAELSAGAGIADCGVHATAGA